MPLIFYLVLINFLVRVGAALVRKRGEPKPLPVCATCSFAHMQYAVGGKRTISCTFAGGVRPITIDVMYCTDYRDRSTPERIAIVGFLREADETETVAAGR
jgi:hypothetical protein